MKVVFDTSVLIAAFYQPLHRPCFSRDVYDYVVENADIYLSPYILHEFHEKCVKKLKMPSHDVRYLESLIRAKAHIEAVKPVQWIPPENILKRDIKDLPILEFAVAVSADLLLSWDKDLRDLKKVETTLILSPAEFWNRLNEF